MIDKLRKQLTRFGSPIVETRQSHRATDADVPALTFRKTYCKTVDSETRTFEDGLSMLAAGGLPWVPPQQVALVPEEYRAGTFTGRLDARSPGALYLRALQRDLSAMPAEGALAVEFFVTDALGQSSLTRWGSRH